MPLSKIQPLPSYRHAQFLSNLHTYVCVCIYVCVYIQSSVVAQTVKNLPTMKKPWFNPWVGKIPQRREWLPTPVFLPGEFHGQRSLVGYSPWGRKESDTAEQLPHICVCIYVGLPVYRYVHVYVCVHVYTYTCMYMFDDYIHIQSSSIASFITDMLKWKENSFSIGFVSILF